MILLRNTLTESLSPAASLCVTQGQETICTNQIKPQWVTWILENSQSHTQTRIWINILYIQSQSLAKFFYYRSSTKKKENPQFRLRSNPQILTTKTPSLTNNDVNYCDDTIDNDFENGERRHRHRRDCYDFETTVAHKHRC